MTGLTIRRRLTLALAAALLPVLLLGAVQSWFSFREDTEQRRSALIAEAETASLLARAKLESAAALLEALAPDTLGVNCLPRLRAVRDKLEGYENLVRFTPAGRISCAADAVPADPNRAAQPWFQALARGERLEITSGPAGHIDEEAAVVAAVRTERPDGSFDGVLVAVIRLSSLRPHPREAGLPHRTEVALADRNGSLLTVTNRAAFTTAPQDWTAQTLKRGAYLFKADSPTGERRVFAGARLVDDDVFVLLSAPEPNVWSWARLDPISNIGLPLLAWLLALIAVGFATERVVVRWLSYLDRIAQDYAEGRFTSRPVQVSKAPDEIRALAHTLDEMGLAITARDASLRDSLAQKDALMREIHHRVKNNLQVITSMLNMQQRQLTDPAAKAAMGDMRQRITALALIYRALYQSSDLRRVEVHSFLEELVAQLLNGEGPKAYPVRTAITSDELLLDPDKLAPFALFAVEALTNAFKHAFPGRAGQVTVSLVVDGAEARLEIVDDGVGGAAEAASGGVGRTLMTAFARQLRGRAELAALDGGGMAARLFFPVPDPEPHPPLDEETAALPAPRPFRVSETRSEAA
ncbi:MAG: sensor histidine kinase [Proteobacteria bacterium]|nr:sensor histidine kinase [Pseudomonadota bacterium]MBW3616915.1 sensor histidine kinase [Pseudomonadota bacterium]